jgi:hypothetical protein
MKTRKQLWVDEKALIAAILNAVLPASEAFPILDAVGVPQSSRAAFFGEESSSSKACARW